MSLSDKYQQASYRGIDFSIRSEKTAGGKKFVIHEYPNSDKRYVEELGLKPGVFSFRGFVHGNDALTNRDKLKKAFAQEGLGVLIHPLYGRIEVKATDWDFTSEETSLGEINFTVTMYESESNVSLIPSVTGASLVTAAADNARSLGYSAMKATLVINKAQEAIKTTQLVSRTILDVVSGKVKSLSDLDPAALSAFDRVFGTSSRELFETAVSAESLSNTISSFYESIRGLTTPDEQRSMWRDLTDYEIDRVQGPTNTVIRESQETNTNVMNSHTRINALVNLFESTAYTTFSTTDELQAARRELDEKFYSRLGSEINNPLAGDGELRNAIQELRTIVNTTLDELSENTFNLLSISPGETSIPLLSYFYYGSLDNEDTIRQLNPDVNSSDLMIADSVEVLA